MIRLLLQVFCGRSRALRAWYWDRYKRWPWGMNQWIADHGFVDPSEG